MAQCLHITVVLLSRHKDRAHMSPQEEEDLNEFVDQIQLRFGISIPRGYNKDVQHMAHLLEDLQVAFKPLVMYLFFELLNLWSSILLTFIGFRKYSTPSFSYWGRNLEQPVKPLPEPVCLDSSAHPACCIMFGAVLVPHCQVNQSIYPAECGITKSAWLFILL